MSYSSATHSSPSSQPPFRTSRHSQLTLFLPSLPRRAATSSTEAGSTALRITSLPTTRSPPNPRNLRRSPTRRTRICLPTKEELLPTRKDSMIRPRSSRRGTISDSRNRESFVPFLSFPSFPSLLLPFHPSLQLTTSSFLSPFSRSGAAVIPTHPRALPALARRPDTARKDARELRKEKKAEEKAKREEERRKIKGEKRREMEKKLMLLGLGKDGKGTFFDASAQLERDQFRSRSSPSIDEVLTCFGSVLSSNTELTMDDLDLDADFDESAHDQKIAALFESGNDWGDDVRSPSFITLHERLCGPLADFCSVLPRFRPTGRRETNLGRRVRRRGGLRVRDGGGRWRRS